MTLLRRRTLGPLSTPASHFFWNRAVWCLWAAISTHTTCTESMSARMTWWTRVLWISHCVAVLAVISTQSQRRLQPPPSLLLLAAKTAAHKRMPIQWRLPGHPLKQKSLHWAQLENAARVFHSPFVMCLKCSSRASFFLARTNDSYTNKSTFQDALIQLSIFKF